MAPPIWPNGHGRPLPTRPCPRPGVLAGRAPSASAAAASEHLRHVDGQAYRVESYVNWCGHAQESAIVDRPGGPHLILV